MDIPFTEMLNTQNPVFRNISNNDDVRAEIRPEALIGENARKALRTCLNIAKQDERISNWLFSNKDYPYVQNGPPIAPKNFKESLALRLSHQIEQELPHLAAQNLFSSSSDKAKSIYMLDSTADLLLTPVFHSGHLLFGYGITIPIFRSPFRRLHNFPVPASLLDKPHGSARFVYNSETKQLLCVMNAISPFLTVVFSVLLTDIGKRERYLFGIENKQYVHPFLPNNPLLVITNIDYRVSHLSANNNTSGNNDNNSSTDDNNINSNRRKTYNNDSNNEQSSNERSSPSPSTSSTTSGTLDPNVTMDNDNMNGTNELDNVAKESSPNYMNDDTVNDIFQDWMKPASQTMNDNDDIMNNLYFPFDPISSSEFNMDLPSISPSQLTTSKTTATTTTTKPCVGSVNDVDLMTEQLCDLKLTLAGKFYGPNFQRDILDSKTGDMKERLVANVTTETEVTVETIRDQLIEYAAKLYYASSINEAVGNKPIPVHSTPPGISPTFRTDWNINFHNSTVSSSSAPLLLAPRISPSTININANPNTPNNIDQSNNVTKNNVLQKQQLSNNPDIINANTTTTSRVDEKRLKEIRLEEKRRRNRESAARSNLKRKLKEQQQYAELESLKAKVVVLKQRKQQLSEENGRLRHAINTN